MSTSDPIITRLTQAEDLGWKIVGQFFSSAPNDERNAIAIAEKFSKIFGVPFQATTWDGKIYQATVERNKIPAADAPVAELAAAQTLPHSLDKLASLSHARHTSQSAGAAGSHRSGEAESKETVAEMESKKMSEVPLYDGSFFILEDSPDSERILFKKGKPADYKEYEKLVSPSAQLNHAVFDARDQNFRNKQQRTNIIVMFHNISSAFIELCTDKKGRIVASKVKQLHDFLEGFGKFTNQERTELRTSVVQEISSLQGLCNILLVIQDAGKDIDSLQKMNQFIEDSGLISTLNCFPDQESLLNTCLQHFAFLQTFLETQISIAQACIQREKQNPRTIPTKEWQQHLHMRDILNQSLEQTRRLAEARCTLIKIKGPAIELHEQLMNICSILDPSLNRTVRITEGRTLPAHFPEQVQFNKEIAHVVDEHQQGKLDLEKARQALHDLIRSAHLNMVKDNPTLDDALKQFIKKAALDMLKKDYTPMIFKGLFDNQEAFTKLYRSLPPLQQRFWSPHLVWQDSQNQVYASSVWKRLQHNPLQTKYLDSILRNPHHAPLNLLLQYHPLNTGQMSSEDVEKRLGAKKHPHHSLIPLEDALACYPLEDFVTKTEKVEAKVSESS